MMADRLARVLLRTEKSAYVRITGKANNFCKTCEGRIYGEHIARRVKSRIDARFCHKCFERMIERMSEHK